MLIGTRPLCRILEKTTFLLLCTSQRMALPSFEALTSHLPSGLNCTTHTSSACSVSVCTGTVGSDSGPAW